MLVNATTEYVTGLLSGANDYEAFIIPKYQRPYKWELDECQTLWDDIFGVFENTKGGKKNEYFLGSVVTFKKDNKILEVIDGQQRITTLTLLFKALYDRAKYEQKDEYAVELGKHIWKHEIGEGFDFSNLKLISEVALASDKEIWQTILSEQADMKKIKESKSNYAKNFLFFSDMVSSEKLPCVEWEKLCKFILDTNLYVLLVTCDTQTSAMTIFNTLNARGMPLSNSDIFKGDIFQYLDNNGGKTSDFAEQWKNIEEKIKTSKKIKDLDFIFNQYMHVIRAINDDTDTSLASLLDFFTKKDLVSTAKRKCWGVADENNVKWLYRPETMPFVEKLTHFWCAPKDFLSQKAARYIQVLGYFPNDYWCSFVSCLVWKNKEALVLGEQSEQMDKETFSKDFEKHLPLFIKAITLNFLAVKNIKGLVYKLSAALIGKDGDTLNKTHASISNLKMIDEDEFYKIKPRIKTEQYLLYLYSYIYNNDDFSSDIEDGLEIEHILPKKWGGISGWNKKDAEVYLEKIGNKILLRKEINIKCGDKFFTDKQKEYIKDENIKEVRELGKRDSENWLKEDIETRGKKIYNTLKDFLESSDK